MIYSVCILSHKGIHMVLLSGFQPVGRDLLGCRSDFSEDRGQARGHANFFSVE